MISKDNYTCSVCLGIFVDPCQLNCKHTFCQPCLLDIIDFNNISFKCPMCRIEYSSNIELKIDEELQKLILENYPEEYQKRKLLIAEGQKMLPSEIKIKVKYGNFYKFHGENNDNEDLDDEDDEEVENNHQWTAYADLDYTKQQDKIALNNLDLHSLIKWVRFQLDETFFPDEITRREPPYMVVRFGWDTFTIPITIKFKKEYKIDPIKLEHHLVFEGDGTEKCQIVKIDISNLKEYKALQNIGQQQQIQL